jgi:uncharacterized membrane protein
MTTRTMAKALGWFSIGLGLAESMAPRRMAKATGLDGRSGLMPVLGLREITSGIGILATEKPSGWLQSRVAGDIMDLAVLASAFPSSKANRNRLAVSAAMVAGVTALDYICSRDMVGKQVPPNLDNKNVFRTITINRPATQIYEFWRKFENLPQIIPDLKSVTTTGPTTQHWIARGPGGVDVEWDAELTEDQGADRISWRSLPGATVPNSGTVRFEELKGDRGTVVRLRMSYEPPAWSVGKVAKFFGKSPEQQTMEFLRKLKQLLETGEIATTVGQPAGRKLSYSPKFDVAARKMAEVS